MSAAYWICPSGRLAFEPGDELRAGFSEALGLSGGVAAAFGKADGE